MLVYPILHYLSLGQWRLIAVFAAVTIGASAVGLLSGGTCAALFFPTDVRVTEFSALMSHLESFWREVIILNIVIVLSALLVSRSGGRALI
jgi:hypothetical protein